jgi:hypothetical protein
MMNMKGFGRKRLWPNRDTISGICLQGLSKTMKFLAKDIMSYASRYIAIDEWTASCLGLFTYHENGPQYPLDRKLGGS